MGQKRKRPGVKNASSKRSRVEEVAAAANHRDHAVLKHYFAKVTTLREHLVSDLNERKCRANIIDAMRNEVDSPVAKVLDSVIVGSNASANKSALRERRAQDAVSFTQQLPGSTIGSHAELTMNAQLEVTDFVIWLSFRRNPPPSKPSHLLSQGFERFAARGYHGLDLSAAPGIPGIVCQYTNSHVEFVTSIAWCSLLQKLGRGGDIVMVDLLLECCLFQAVGPNTKAVEQFSGIPLSALQPFNAPISVNSDGYNTVNSKVKTTLRSPSSIKFVRNRMYFAQPSLSANGKIRFGLHNIHALNRYNNIDSDEETTCIIKYIFPKQFHLHNVFTSVLDHRESALPFKDYTLREKEFKRKALENETKTTRLPKRLAGQTFELVRKLRKLHQKCPYTELFRHYCAPSDEAASFLENQKVPETMTNLATPVSRVSAFCQAVLKRIIPHVMWGEGDAGEHNKRLILKRVDDFLRARKFESFSLQYFLDGLKVSSIPWLALPRQSDHKLSQTDFQKRKELLAEFIYYTFDSLLIPLVRSNFHVTETNVHRNRLFYFRHDIWKLLSEPALNDLKESMFEEWDSEVVKKRLAERSFGYSSVRLLPKVTGFRPITNLRRRPYVWQNGRRVLGRSINSALNPAFRALNYEKSTHLDDLGCSLWSVGDIYPKLKEYRSRLEQMGKTTSKLYLAKVDVQACFDTIPQKSLLRVVEALLSTDKYIISNKAHVRPPDITTLREEGGRTFVKPVTKYSSSAVPAAHLTTPDHQPENDKVPGTSVLVAPLGQHAYRRQQILDLISQHVSFNLIKIGRKYYRQRNGIPQGSVLSSILCNFFYGRLERDILSFLHRPDSLLMRLVDDFLLVSTEKSVAERFLRVMLKGVPEYGVSVRMAKTLVNFESEIGGGGAVPSVAGGGRGFPYCGLLIDMRDLSISKHGELKAGTTVSDSLTVEYSTLPGKTFRRKALNALKIQLNGMYFDTSFNTLDTALSNIHRLFSEAAHRIDHYTRSLPKKSQPSFETIKHTIEDLIELAYTMMSRRRRTPASTGNAGKDYECAVRKNQVIVMACQAFTDVLLPRQTRHGALLDWLKRTVKSKTAALSKVEALAVRRVVPALSS